MRRLFCGFLSGCHSLLFIVLIYLLMYLFIYFLYSFFKVQIEGKGGQKYGPAFRFLPPNPPKKSPKICEKSWEATVPLRWPRRLWRLPTWPGPPWNAATTTRRATNRRARPRASARLRRTNWRLCDRRIGVLGTCSSRI